MDKRDIAFARNLKHFRKALSLTQADLAYKINYSEKSIEKWEAGKSIPPLATLCRLCRLLGVSLDTLVYSDVPCISYYLGIDGGGTKTAFVLEDHQGNVVSELILGPSNPNDIGMERSLSLLQSGIGEVCRGIDKRTVSVFAGIAGGMSKSNADAFDKYLSTSGFGRIGHGSDLENARELALRGGDGVVAILGTGSIAYAQYGGVCKRIGGWGYLLDNGGSGYDLGRDALNAALCAIDGTGTSTVLCRLLEEKLEASIPDAIPTIYSGGKRLIASCAEVLFEACDRKDAVAMNILDRNMKRIAHMLKIGQQYVGSDHAPLVLMGGLCRRKDLLEPVIQKHLDLSNPLIFSSEPMVKGAVLLARKEKNHAEHRNAQ